MTEQDSHSPSSEKLPEDQLEAQSAGPTDFSPSNEVSESTSEPDELAIVEVTETENSQVEIRFILGKVEEEVNKHKPELFDLSEPSKGVIPKKFVRKAISEDEVRSRLSKLSQEWFRVAVGFLQVVPELTRINQNYAGEKLTEDTVAYASRVSVGQTSSFDPNGVKTTRYQIPLADFSLLLRRMGRSLHVHQAAATLAKSSLGALISDYEAFITNLLRTLGRLHPAVFIPDDETVSIKALEDFTSYEDFVEDLIDDKIQELLQSKTHFQVLKWIEEKFKVNLTSDKEIIHDFIEICQRRNLIAHAGGIVNKRYLRVCSEQGLSPTKLPKLGDLVAVDRNYLRRATARVFLVGFFTLHMVWQKVLPKQRDSSLDLILASSHDFLDSGLTKMSRRLCKFGLSSERAISVRQKTYLTINLAQSFLFDPAFEEAEKKKEIEQILRQSDWTMVSPTVELALICLRRDFSALDEATKKAVASGLQYFEAMTWSIFREVRDLPDFAKHFKR